jgi:hypothetical protein
MDMNFKWYTRDEKLLVVAHWWKEQQGRCCLCGQLMKPYSRQHTTDPDAATVEHLIPKRDNGPDTAGNVRLAHASCNNALGAHWERNRHRAKLGLPAISDKEALHTAIGNRRARIAQSERERRAVDDPRVQEVLKTFPGAIVKARKMTAVETARWLALQGIRGA